MTHPTEDVGTDELLEALTDRQREIILRGGGEINCDDGYNLIDRGIFAKVEDRQPDDEYQGFDFTPLGHKIAAALRARAPKEQP